MYRIRNLLVATCSLAAVSAHAATEITYWLWDALQLPAYLAAAAAFEKANPDIKVKITQPPKSTRPRTPARLIRASALALRGKI